MSFVPFLLNELMGDYKCSTLNDLIDQNFGQGIAQDIFPIPAQRSLAHAPLRCGYIRPWRLVEPVESGVSSLANDNKEFKVSLDVQQFKPEELKVTVENGFLIVNGKHEERSDEHGFVSRQFTRRYKIPENVDQSALASNLSSDGVLSLRAPKAVKESEKSIEVPITQTHQPIRITDDKKETKPQENEGTQ